MNVLVPYGSELPRLMRGAIRELARRRGVERVYRACFRDSKAEVLLLDLRQPKEKTRGLYAAAASCE